MATYKEDFVDLYPYLTYTDKPEDTNAASPELPTASATVLGGVKVGTGLKITNGVLSVDSGQ